MHAKHLVFATLLLDHCGVKAQLVAQPAPDLPAPSTRLAADADGRYGPLDGAFKRYSPVYGGNEAANPNDRVFKGFRTDPRYVLGIKVNEYLAFETGYSYLWDEGFHKIDTFGRRAGAAESAVAAGDLRARSNTTYLAARITIPVNERLSAYGKFGVAHSTVANDGFTTPRMAQARAEGRLGGEFAGESSTGPYGAVGARYKLNDRATVSGEVRMNGSAAPFGKASNASGLRGSVGIGF